MTAINVGLMGFGRIGRNLFRILYRRDDVRIVAISDTADPAALEYLLRFDTILGRFPDEVSVRDGNLYAWGRQVRLLAGEKPGDVRWGDLGVDVVVEATSRPRSRRELERHLEMGARHVLLCSPATDPPDLTVVVGINDGDLRPEHRIVSNSSCTAHAAAPVLRLLEEAFGIERVFLSSVHAYTNQQRLADVPTETSAPAARPPRTSFRRRPTRRRSSKDCFRRCAAGSTASRSTSWSPTARWSTWCAGTGVR